MDKVDAADYRKYAKKSLKKRRLPRERAPNSTISGIRDMIVTELTQISREARNLFVLNTGDI